MLVCQNCLEHYPDAEPDDESTGAITCESCGETAVCYSIGRQASRPKRRPAEDDDEEDEQIDSTPSRLFPVHPPRAGANGQAQSGGAVSSDYWLYLETRPRKITQFRGRPSPGDLDRISKGSLRVFYCRDGRFSEIRADGGENLVEVIGEPHLAPPPRIVEHEPVEIAGTGTQQVSYQPEPEDPRHLVRSQFQTDELLSGIDFGSLSDADEPADEDE